MQYTFIGLLLASVVLTLVKTGTADEHQTNETLSVMKGIISTDTKESRHLEAVSAMLLVSAGLAARAGASGHGIVARSIRRNRNKQHRRRRPQSSGNYYGSGQQHQVYKRNIDIGEEEDEDDEAVIIRTAVMLDQQSGGCVARLLCQLHQQQIMQHRLQRSSQQQQKLDQDDPSDDKKYHLFVSVLLDELQFRLTGKFNDRSDQPSHKEAALLRSAGSVANIEVCDQVFHRCQMKDRNLVNSSKFANRVSSFSS